MKIKKKQTNGFTLMETLAAIFIINLIVIIIYTSINYIIFNSKTRIDEQSKKLLMDASKDYTNEYRNTENWKEGQNKDKNTTFCISIQSLIDSGYYKENKNNIKEWINEYFIYGEIDKNGIYNYKLINNNIEEKCKVRNESSILNNQRETYTFKNEGLDIATLDYSAIKINDNTYTIENIFKGLLKITPEIQLPSYITLIIDTSGSMTSKNKWTNAKNAAIKLSQNITNELNNTQIALIEYGTGAKLRRTFKNTALVNKDFTQAKKGNYTNTSIGIDLASIINKELDSESKKFIIILYDGAPSKAPYYEEKINNKTIKISSTSDAKYNYFSNFKTKYEENKIKYSNCNSDTCFKYVENSSNYLKKIPNTTLITIGYNFTSETKYKELSSLDNKACYNSDYQKSNNNYCYYNANDKNKIDEVFNTIKNNIVTEIKDKVSTHLKIELTPPNNIAFMKNETIINKIIYSIDLINASNSKIDFIKDKKIISSISNIDFSNLENNEYDCSYQIKINPNIFNECKEKNCNNININMFNANITYYNKNNEVIKKETIKNVPKLTLNNNQINAIN